MTEIHRLTAALADRYRLERPLGQGGMATVYLAHDVRHDRAVAVKVLRPELAAVIGGERFITEIRTTANLQHPHILPLFDSGEADGFLYYVMPYVPGESLRQRLDRERQLPVEEALRIASDVAGALDYAHRNSVIHRDIKPENILLQEGRPVVADFGIALALSAAGGGRMTETGLSLGTPHYMSPEQASADRDLTPRSDIYSLACVLYEMLAGDPPHTGPTSQAILMRILTDDPRPVTDLRRAVPAHVAAALDRALEKLPADRFESASAFDRALGDASFSYERRTDLHVTGRTRAIASPAGTRAWLRDPRSIAALIALAAIIGISQLMPPPAGPAPFPVRLNLDAGNVASDSRINLDISPDGRTIVMSADVDGERMLWIRRAEDAGFQPIPQTENAVFPAFSPDGEWIVYSGSGLRRVHVNGGAPFTVLDSMAVAMPHWGRDGTIVFTTPWDVLRLHESGAIDTLLDRSIASPRLLPDGSGLLFTDEPASVRLLDLATDSVKTLIAEGVDARYVETGHLLFAHPTGGLFAVPFDLRRREVTGQPVRVLDEVSLYRGDEVRYAISRTGTLVYGMGRFSGAIGAPRLLVVHLSGAVDTLPLAPRDFENLRWSPDGRRVAYTIEDGGRSDVFVYDVEVGTTPRRLTSEGDNTEPVWSPDGTRIAFASTRDGTDGADLFVKSLDDAPEVRLLARPGDQTPRDWPEPGRLVFMDDAVMRDGDAPSTSFWMIQPDSGAVPQAYLQSEEFVDGITVAPRGGLAAYEVLGRTSAIYVRTFPEPGRQMLVSEGDVSSPRWSPDGNTLYYWQLAGRTDTLFAARLEREPAFRVLSREVVHAGERLHGWSWDLHPDGDRFIVPKPVAALTGPSTDPAAPERFFVVVNWFEEMRAKLGAGR